MAQKVTGLCFENDRETAETRQCVHCGRHWIYRPGSGRKFGWCMNCGGIHCARPECCVCDPWQRKIEAEARAMG